MRPSGQTHDHPGDRPEPSATGRAGWRVTVAEAAEILGTTTDAVRSRMRRGKLRREEGEDGTVYVLLDAHDTSGQDGLTTANGQKPAENSHSTGAPKGGDRQKTVEDGPLVDALRDQIHYLRGELALERESSSELRRIIVGMTQRIPVVEPETSPGERGGPETVAGGFNNAAASSDSQDPAPRRSWLLRWFGF